LAASDVDLGEVDPAEFVRSVVERFRIGYDLRPVAQVIDRQVVG